MTSARKHEAARFLVGEHNRPLAWVCDCVGLSRSAFYRVPDEWTIRDADVIAALAKLVAPGKIERDSRVIVISTAHGLKFPDFKVQYHENQLREFGVDPDHRNMPVEVDADYEAVKSAVLSRLESSQRPAVAEL